ncbi:MAG: glutathione S-transferase family protein [Novosphingobium sp.]|nr:glutathione S-transferase family protein [Novosphingobium sp.]
MAAKLYMAPYTCARVTAIALEEAGIEFETSLVRFMKGEHKSPEFKRSNPKGKVPALEIDGDLLTENVAILTYLDERFPEAGLMPEAASPGQRARNTADLCFCSSTLHPLVTRIRMPMFFAGPDNAVAVKRTAELAMDEYFQLVEDRLADKPWWYGADWSAMDGYLYWIFWRVEGAGYDVSRFPRFLSHARENERRPAVERALAREEALQRQLEAEGVAFVPPKVG